MKSLKKKRNVKKELQEMYIHIFDLRNHLRFHLIGDSKVFSAVATNSLDITPYYDM